MNLTQRRDRFRAILAGGRCVHPASVYDPLSARIAEDLGFELGMLAGSIASLTVLGAPDLIVLTLTEFAQQILRISRASNLPLLVDADHGYGNALNVKRTVEELETAGVSALTIEDTALPSSYGEVGQTRLISVDEGVGKMRAALAGREDPALVVAARTSAMSVAGLDETILRARAYAATGVDALFLVGANARTIGRRGVCRQPAVDVRQRAVCDCRYGLPQRPQRTRRPPGPHAIHGRHPRRLRGAEIFTRRQTSR